MLPHLTPSLMYERTQHSDPNKMVILSALACHLSHSASFLNKVIFLLPPTPHLSDSLACHGVSRASLDSITRGPEPRQASAPGPQSIARPTTVCLPLFWRTWSHVAHLGISYLFQTTACYLYICNVKSKMVVGFIPSAYPGNTAASSLGHLPGWYKSLIRVHGGSTLLILISSVFMVACWRTYPTASASTALLGMMSLPPIFKYFAPS